MYMNYHKILIAPLFQRWGQTSHCAQTSMLANADNESFHAVTRARMHVVSEVLQLHLVSFHLGALKIYRAVPTWQHKFLDH